MTRLQTFTLLGLVTILSSCRKDSPTDFRFEDTHPDPVSAADLIGTHMCTACGIHNDEKFEWTFTEDRFEIKATDAPIPGEVIETVLGEVAAVSRIEGRWQCVDGDVLLTDISAEADKEYPNVTVRPFLTPILRINFPEHQYVLSKKKDTTMSDPYAGATTISKDGIILLYLRGDEIVKEGSVVGNFDGDQVRKDGSIVGEIQGDVFRHEGSDVWKLDKGNLYSGIEIRLEGSIIGDIRSDGTIWRDGSSWGTVKPYVASTEETMRIMTALYYFSDYFGQD